MTRASVIARWAATVQTRLRFLWVGSPGRQGRRARGQRSIEPLEPRVLLVAPILLDTDLEFRVPAGVATAFPISFLTGGIVDPDTRLKGVALVGVNIPPEAGVLQSSGDGENFLDVLPVGENAAVLFPDLDNVELRFVPAPGFTGTLEAAIRLRGWDGQVGIGESTRGITVSIPQLNLDSASFSAATDTVRIVVEPAPEIPVLRAARLSLDAAEFSGPESGREIPLGLLAADITGIKTPFGGLAITSVEIPFSAGRLELSGDGGATWTPLPSGFLSPRNAILVPAFFARMRFVPAPGFTGEIANAIGFKAWDGTAGLEALLQGQLFDPGLYSSVRAFSVGENFVSLNVVPLDPTSLPLDGAVDVVPGAGPLRLVVPEDGRLVLNLEDPRGTITLFDRSGTPILVAAGDGRAGASLTQHLASGIYGVAVTAGSSTRLATAFIPAPNPLASLSAGDAPSSTGSGDLNQDGWDDIVVANYGSEFFSVYFGLPGGEFRKAEKLPVTAGGLSLQVQDLDGDMAPDLVWVNQGAGTLEIAWNDGAGRFDERQTVGVGLRPGSVTVGRLTGDDLPEFIVTNAASRDISVFLNGGARTFAAESRLDEHLAPEASVIGDWNGDGIADLVVVSDAFPDSQAVISFRQGLGDGTFLGPILSAAGGLGVALAAGDWDGDKKLDLTVVNQAGAKVTILRGDGTGRFVVVSTEPVGPKPRSITTADFNGDSLPDLFVVNESIFRPAFASVLLGRKGGGFEEERRVIVDGALPRGATFADFNKDSRLDVAVVSSGSGSLTVLAGLGDGSFQSRSSVAVGSQPFIIISSDFNNDGVLDLATANFTSGDVSVLLGRAHGGFEPQARLPVFANAVGLKSADLNRDGRTDLVVTRQSDGQAVVPVAYLLGLGDGNFLPAQDAIAGANPAFTDVADMNGDGIPDLVVVNDASNDLHVLLGRNEGGYQPPLITGLPQQQPASVRVGDYNADGLPDAVTMSKVSGSLQVLIGRGGGQFDRGQLIVTGPRPASLDVADVTGDGLADLVVANDATLQIQVYRGLADGTFELFRSMPVLPVPSSILAADVNGDTLPDLVTSSIGALGLISVNFGLGGGDFSPAAVFPVEGNLPFSLAVGDFNGDRQADIATPLLTGNAVAILFGVGMSRFVDGGELVPSSLQPAPVSIDLNVDGRNDLVIVNRAGAVLYHAGGAGAGSFAARVELNSSGGDPALSIAAAAFDGRPRLVVLEAAGDRISVYEADSQGVIGRTGRYSVGGATPLSMATGDFNGDGRDDVVTLNAGSSTISILLCNDRGEFALAATTVVPFGASAVTVADLDGIGPADIALVTQFGGLVSVVLNDGVRFTPVAPQAAGVGSSHLQLFAGNGRVQSRDGAGGITAADFNRDGVMDLLVADEAANSLSLLQGLGRGLYADPARILTGTGPRRVRAADFNNDGWADVVVLEVASGQLRVFLNDRHGRLEFAGAMAAGLEPADISVFDADGDNHIDLVVGNAFGDILTIAGDGTGRFSTSQRVDRDVPLVVADLDGDGLDDVVLANRSLDRVTLIRNARDPRELAEDISIGGAGSQIAGPGAMKLASLNDDNGDGRIDELDIPDLVVANSSGNTILVYHGRGGGQFAPPQSYFAGSRPSGVTIADINSDGRPDLVIANQGSNDVSILLNQPSAAAGGMASFNPGPRLNTGASSGPVSTTVTDITGDGVADIVVTNSQNGTVSLLPGVGGGFFNDLNPAFLQIGNTGGQGSLVIPGTGTAGTTLIAANPAGGQVVVVSNLQQAFFVPNPDPFIQRFGSGGSSPAGLAVMDFNRDGRFDLVIANSGSGSVTFLAGTGTGFDLFRELRSESLQHPSAVALSADGLQLYCTDEGEEVVTVFDLRMLLPEFNGGALPVRQSLLAGSVETLIAPALSRLLVQAGLGQPVSRSSAGLFSIASEFVDFRGGGGMQAISRLFWQIVVSPKAAEDLYALGLVSAVSTAFTSLTDLAGVRLPRESVEAFADWLAPIVSKYVAVTESTSEQLYKLAISVMRALERHNKRVNEPQADPAAQPATQSRLREWMKPPVRSLEHPAKVAGAAVRRPPPPDFAARPKTAPPTSPRQAPAPRPKSSRQQRELDRLMTLLAKDAESWDNIFTGRDNSGTALNHSTGRQHP